MYIHTDKGQDDLVNSARLMDSTSEFSILQSSAVAEICEKSLMCIYGLIQTKPWRKSNPCECVILQVILVKFRKSNPANKANTNALGFHLFDASENDLKFGHNK